MVGFYYDCSSPFISEVKIPWPLNRNCHRYQQRLRTKPHNCTARAMLEPWQGSDELSVSLVCVLLALLLGLEVKVSLSCSPILKNPLSPGDGWSFWEWYISVTVQYAWCLFFHYSQVNSLSAGSMFSNLEWLYCLVLLLSVQPSALWLPLFVFLYLSSSVLQMPNVSSKLRFSGDTTERQDGVKSWGSEEVLGHWEHL